MVSGAGSVRVGRRAVLRAGLAGLVAGAGRPALAGASAAGAAPTLVRIRPGTAVGDSAPESWSHLVVKSIPRLASGDIDTLPEVASHTASLYRTVVAVRVRPPEGGSEARLLNVGIGLAMPHRGRDVVVSSRTVDALGVPLSTIEKFILRQAEGDLARGRVVAQTSTFALYRTPATVGSAGTHEELDLHYAFLVDPDSGGLTSLAWAQAGSGPPDSANRLAPDLVFDCAVDVLAKRLLGMAPVSWSFAMREIPPGRPVALPESLRRSIAEVDRVTPEALESALRDLLEPELAGASS